MSALGRSGQLNNWSLNMAEIGGLIEGFAQASESWAGWRYLLSGSYRQKVHESWKEKSGTRIFAEMIYGVFWIVFSIIIMSWLFGFLVRI